MKNERIETPEEKAQATEFSRRRGIAYVVAKHMPSARFLTVELTLGGRPLGSMIQTLKRGKVSSVSYYLPPIDVNALI